MISELNQCAQLIGLHMNDEKIKVMTNTGIPLNIQLLNAQQLETIERVIRPENNN